MSWGDDAAEGHVPPAPRPTPSWPIYIVLIMSAAAIGVAAILQSFVPALVTYGLLLVGGCGLLFYRRRLGIAATRRAGGVGYLSVGGLERLGLAALALACLVNGLLIAQEIASWDWATILGRDS